MSTDGQPLCVWTTDTRSFAVHIHAELLRRIAAEAWIGFKRVPRRGLEIGGILLGRRERQSRLTRLWIDSFELLESEHRSGPSYVLSELDWARLDTLLAMQGPSCIGVFRSHTRSEPPVPQKADADLLGRSSLEDNALFLILVPVKGSACLFARSSGMLKCVHEFPLASSVATRPDAAQIVTAAPEIERPPRKVRSDALVGLDTSLADTPALDTTLPDPYPNLPDEPQSYASKFLGYDLKNAMWVIAGMLIPLGLVLATSLFSPSVSRPTARQNNPLPRYLPLTVEQAGRSLALHWDPHSPAIQNAERAILHIEDGEIQTDRHLAQRDLQDGLFTYQAKSSGVLFQIEIYSQQPSAFGLVQATNVARAPSGVAPVQSASGEAIDLLPPKSSRRSSISDEDNAVSRNQATNLDPVNAIPAAVTQPQGLATSVGRTEPESTRPPEVVHESPKPSPVFASTATVVASPAEASERLLSVDISTEPVSESLLGRFVEKLPLLRRTRKPVTAAPVPVYEAQPLLNSPGFKRIAAPVSIGVRVSVAETGMVKEAEVVDYGEPPNWRAANAALEAARRWTFQPARIEDAAVSSEIILRFRFRP